MTKDQLKALSPTINLNEIYRRAGLKPNTIRAAMSSQPRPLTDDEREAIRKVLEEVAAEIREAAS